MPMRPNGSIARGGGSRPDWWIVIPIWSLAETARTSSSCGCREQATKRSRVRAAVLSRPSPRRARSSEAELVASALPRLDALIGEGVTTVEIKSGYGLNTETEMRQLSAARALGRNRPVTIRTTFLGAHALPPEAEGDKDRYIDLVCRTMLPAVAQAGLADAVDAFMEGIAFSRDQTARVFRGGKDAWIAGQTARGSVVESGRSSACCGIFRSVRRSSGAHGSCRRRGYGAGRYGGGASAGGVLLHS